MGQQVAYKCVNPVVLIVFNRPDKTRILLDKLRHVLPQKVYVVADGPRLHVPSDQQKVEEVRGLIEKIDWDCEIIRIYSDANLSGPIRVPSAFDQIFKSEEQVIILEDDCIPSLSFFQFCDELLDKYKEDERIGTVCGFNLEFDFLGRPIDGIRPESYFFSRYPASWGWATWRRVWKNFDHDLKDFPSLRKAGFFDNLSPHRSVVKFWIDTFDSLHNKVKRNWDYKLVYSLLRKGQLSIIPNLGLVENIGTSDGSGANYSRESKSYIDTKKLHECDFPLLHPRVPVPDERYDRRITTHFFTANKLRKGLRLIRDYIC